MLSKPLFILDADPDPTFRFDADPDSAHHQCATATDPPRLHFEPPRLHFVSPNLNCEFVSVYGLKSFI
jgi:hypothetical protein